MRVLFDSDLAMVAGGGSIPINVPGYQIPQSVLNDANAASVLAAYANGLSNPSILMGSDDYPDINMSGLSDQQAAFLTTNQVIWDETNHAAGFDPNGPIPAGLQDDFDALAGASYDEGPDNGDSIQTIATTDNTDFDIATQDATFGIDPSTVDFATVDSEIETDIADTIDVDITDIDSSLADVTADMDDGGYC